MEYLAFVYTLLLVAICLMMAVLLARTSRLLKEPKDDEALKSWLEQQLAAQAKDFSAGRMPWPSRTTPPSAASARRSRLPCRG